MEHKRYFDTSTTSFTVFFIVIGVLLLLGALSEKLLSNFGLLESGEEKAVSTNHLIIATTGIVCFTLTIYSVFCFYRFMSKANKGKLFSEVSSLLWKQISTIYIVIGVLFALLSMVNFKFIGGIPVCGFISSIAYSFSKIFKDSSILKQENDLTI
jgi:succinate dehydrogenase hydrophobic anchor subunit